MHGSFVVKKKTLIYYNLFLLLLVAPLITPYISMFSAVDEAITIIGIGIVCNNYILKKYIPGCKIFYLLIVIICIGVLSTVVYKIALLPIAAIYDFILLAKPFVIFLIFLSIPETVKKEILQGLNGIAKVIFVFIFIYYIVYRTFGFFLMSNVFPILSNMAQVSWLRVVCLNIIAATNERKITQKYIVIFYIGLFISGVGGFASALFASMTLYLYLYREDKERKLHIWQIIILAGACFAFAYSDLQDYIFSGNAPRALLLRYGFVTAINYFPLGSGFASYGSEMAKRYYSKLYYEYGFDRIWSMSPEANREGSNYGVTTLNDCYLGMIVGQYGWIGFFCYIGIIYAIYKLLSRGQNNTYSKAALISTLITILSSIMVSNNTSSFWGICMYAVMGLAVIPYKIIDEGQENDIIDSYTSI
ncbi:MULTISPECIES: hypothetical protein [unclassified Candidatus Paralachnospira]|uniref:hypothetical protein n=1 Tax=unclassified Candidatus Paralachnospira TaxID=3099471 RepID=UPI003F8F9D6A